MKPEEHGEWVRSLLERFEQPLVRYAVRITGNMEQARDVVQDTFLQLCAADRERVGEHAAAWLYTVCRNRALDVARKERRMTPLTDMQAQTCESPEPPPSAVAERADAQNEIQRALHTLPENQREVIRLKFQDAMSYREISQVTGLSESNVGYLLHTAIRSIRRKVASKFELPEKKFDKGLHPLADGEQS